MGLELREFPEERTHQFVEDEEAESVKDWEPDVEGVLGSPLVADFLEVEREGDGAGKAVAMCVGDGVL